MSTTWKKEQRKTLSAVIAILAILSLLIYWQGSVTVKGILESLLSTIQFDFSSLQAPYESLLLDLFILIIGGVISFSFFAHFVIPLQNKYQFVEVIKIMANTLIGKKPEIINLRNGLEMNNGFPSTSTDASIILLDIASAAVLRKNQVFTKAIGPGIHMLADHEKLAGSLDLRIHRRSIGPLPGEDPFAENDQTGDQAIILAVKNRREESTGLSRDGIEIIPRIDIRFRVGGRQSSSRIPFPFHPEFAWRAIANEAVSPNQPSDARKNLIHWDWLPAQLAGDLWRVFLRKYTLQELFENTEEIKIGENKRNGLLSGLQEIELMINKRLTSSLVDGINGKKSSPEFQLLRNRGVQVIDVRIREVFVDPRKEELRLINEWSENWEMHAIQQGIQNNEIQEKGKSKGVELGAKEFVDLVSEDLLMRLSITDGENILPPSEKESLSLLLESTLRNVSNFPEINQSIFNRLKELKDSLAEGDSLES